MHVSLAAFLVAVLAVASALALARISENNRLMRIELAERNERLQKAITAEREALEALKKAQGRLVESEKLAGLGQMVAGVAHEINNPVSFIATSVAPGARSRIARAETPSQLPHSTTSRVSAERCSASARAVSGQSQPCQSSGTSGGSAGHGCRSASRLSPSIDHLANDVLPGSQTMIHEAPGGIGPPARASRQSLLREPGGG